MNYSVLMSVYYKENPEWLDESINSMFNQTAKTNDFVLIEDGKLTPKLDKVVEKYEKKYPHIFRIIKLDKNEGLGSALSIGVKECKNELIARMDSDDISIPNRMKIQLEYIKNHDDIDLLGSWHTEFLDNIDNVTAIKKLPENHEDIVKYSKYRNPFSHSSIIFKKHSLLKAGNYRTYHLVEDYDMWIRMIQNGCKCYNIQKSLTYVRVSKDLYKRRGGIKYLKSMLKFKREQYKSNYFSLKEYVTGCIISTIVCLLPNNIRNLIYKKLLRK